MIFTENKMTQKLQIILLLCLAVAQSSCSFSDRPKKEIDYGQNGVEARHLVIPKDAKNFKEENYYPIPAVQNTNDKSQNANSLVIPPGMKRVIN